VNDDFTDLPDDIEALKTALIAALAEVAVAQAQRSSDLALIAYLKLEIAKLNRDRFGPRSERTARLLAQLELQLEELTASASADELAAEQAAAKTSRVNAFDRKHPARRAFPEHLPRERIIVPGPIRCACCGGARLAKLGEDVTETLEVIPRSWKVIQTVREKFTCRDCESISQPPAPFHVTPRGWAGPSLLAMILFEKFGQHQPLNRQAERYAREGVELSLSTLADQVGACTKVLMPLFGLLEAHVMAADRLHGRACWGGRPHGIACQNWVLSQHPRPEPSMNQYKRIAIDTSKAVFTLHGIDQADRPILRINLSRAQMIAFFTKLPAIEIAMEACGGSHYWARELAALGHRVVLIPPQYIKPYVKRGKNDRNDAEAICEAAGRPGMHFVPVKSADQQAQGMVLKVRETLVDQRTALVNTLRGHAAEFGVIAGKGVSNIIPLLEKIAAETAIPLEARETMALLGEEIARLDARLKQMETKLNQAHKANPVSVRLASIPGVGPITALTLATEIDPTAFESGRHLAAWAGLTPREHSTGGKQRLGGISRAGNERLRALFVLGATSVIKVAERPGNKLANEWLLKLLRRRPRKVAAVALANKMVRIAWAMMMSGETYRRAPAAGVS